jgi:hypothetical protein
LNKEHRNIIPWGAMVTGGVCSMYLQHYISVISLVSKWERLFRGRPKAFRRGSTPRRVQARGAAPR